MEELLEACKALFDRSNQAVGVAHVLVDDEGNPYDFAYAYLNQAMADISNQSREDLLGFHAYEGWGNDDMGWLVHFADAALHGISCEFETCAILFERFFSVSVTPLVPGYCTFIVQDLTTWIDQDLYMEGDHTVGLFFLDMRTQNIVLSSATQDAYGFEKKYLSAVSFAERLFGQEGARIMAKKLEEIPQGAKELRFEGRSLDGRWLKISSGRIAQSERFSICIVEDFTQTKAAEERSAHRMDVIECLTRENFALYVIDLEHESVEVYNRTDDLIGTGFVRYIVDKDYEREHEAYLSNVVAEEDRAQVEAVISREGLMQLFASDEPEIALTYRRRLDDEEKYVEARILRLSGSSQTAVLAVRNTHAEMKEQLRQKRALQKALELAQHASAAKSVFLTNMSHDLRTPMNSIVGFTDLALENANDAAHMEDCLQKIKRSSDHLLSLINDVLDVSRIESGAIDLEEEAFDLKEFALEMSDIFSGEALRKSIDFTIDTSSLRQTEVIADRQHIAQILVNLMGNAFKFTGEGGSVAVTFTEFNEAQSDYGAHVPQGYGRFEFIVSDTGCGMKPEFLERLFVPYERDGLDEVNATEGTGLGMPITKNLVELLGGAIEVKSEVGRGSEFVVTLPLRLTEQRLDGSRGARQTDGNTASQDVSFEGKRALVVDDDDLSREITQEILKKAGFSVEEASHGKAAVERVLSTEPGHFDVILMDMRMPQMSGDEAARAIYGSGRADLQDVPIIALTADAFEEGRKRSHRAGMVAHITKPFKRADLIDLLIKFVK